MSPHLMNLGNIVTIMHITSKPYKPIEKTNILFSLKPNQPFAVIDLLRRPLPQMRTYAAVSFQKPSSLGFERAIMRLFLTSSDSRV